MATVDLPAPATSSGARFDMPARVARQPYDDEKSVTYVILDAAKCCADGYG